MNSLRLATAAASALLAACGLQGASREHPAQAIRTYLAQHATAQVVGVLIRITGSGNGYHVWDPSEASVVSGGVSFSYIRADANSTRLAWHKLDGLIFAANADAEAATIVPPLLCAFPADAETVHRANSGCGMYKTAEVSVSCQEQGIFTGEEWYAHFVSRAKGDVRVQCGFKIHGAEGSAKAFEASIDGRRIAGTDAKVYSRHNEYMLATWPQGAGASIPLVAFFYIVANGQSGLAGAQRNQRDLLYTDGVAVPIIRIDLGSSVSDAAALPHLPNVPPG